MTLLLMQMEKSQWLKVENRQLGEHVSIVSYTQYTVVEDIALFCWLVRGKLKEHFLLKEILSIERNNNLSLQKLGQV